MGLMDRDHVPQHFLNRLREVEDKVERLLRHPTEQDLSAYLMLDGSRELTADWDAGDYKITARQFESDVATGTAPFIVASETKVENLNADMLDGLDATDFVQCNGTRQLSANWDAGIYEIRSRTFQSDVATGTAPFIVASTTLVSNLNADLLDGNEAAAFATAAHAHSDYLNKNGSVALTANWDSGDYEIRARTFESDVATGTAPLTVASTTLVSNLNADLLDGNEAAAFATSGHSHSAYVNKDGTVAMTADWDAGSYQIRSAKFWADNGEVKIEISSGDPVVLFNIGGSDKWVMGADDDSSDNFLICSGGTLGSNVKIRFRDGYPTSTDTHIYNGCSIGTGLSVGFSHAALTGTVEFADSNRSIFAVGSYDLYYLANNGYLVAYTAGGTSGIRPDIDEAGKSGDPGYGWAEVNAKAFNDIGCLGSFDDGVELMDGRMVGDVEALVQVQLREDGKLTPYGVRQLDYATMPKAVAREIWGITRVEKSPQTGEEVLNKVYGSKEELADIKGKTRGKAEFYRFNADLTALISIMMGAIKELHTRLSAVEGAQG